MRFHAAHILARLEDASQKQTKALFKGGLALLAVVGLFLSASAHAQGIPRPDGRAGARDPLPGRRREPDVRPDLKFNPCEGNMNVPLITLTLEPAEIYPGDRVTLRWSVRDARPGVGWAYPVHIRCSWRLPRELPEPARNSGSYSFIANDAPQRGTFTLETLCSTKKVEYARVTTPSVSRLTEDSGLAGDRLQVIGSDFGSEQGSSHVDLIVGNQTLAMTVDRWRDTIVHVRVPANAPSGNGSVRVIKGRGRLESNSRAFRVFKSMSISNATLQAVLTALALGQTRIHLHHGDNASSVDFSAAMTALGAPDQTFTLPEMRANVPEGARIAASILLPFGAFPERVRYRVNSVDSNGVTLNIANGQLVLRITFESGGPEVKGELKYCDLGVFGACVTDHWSDSLAPDVQVNNASVTVRFTPAVANGSLTFSSAATEFTANFQIGGDWEDWLVNRVTDYRNQVRPRIEDRVNAALNTAAVRSAVGNALMNALRAQGVTRITSVSASGGNIVIVYE